MLTSLSIHNYAIIEHLEIDFQNGFSVITGETGAGKSIIMGALSLVLGQRADAKNIRNGEKKCVIEAVFQLKNDSCKAYFIENNLDYEESCILRREITDTGKSRAFINDTPVSLLQLKTLSENLIDIHSQHANLLLKKDDFQLNVIDTLAQNKTLYESYLSAYRKMKNLSEKIEQIKEENAKNLADKEYLLFQTQQLQKAAFTKNEQTALEQQQLQLANAEEIKMQLSRAEYALSDENNGIVNQLKEAINALQQIEKYLPSKNNLNDRLHSSWIEIKDIADEISSLQSDIEYDPALLEKTNNRLDLLYSLLQKHQAKNLGELLEFQQKLEQKLNGIEDANEQIELLEKELLTLTKETKILATELTVTRKKAATTLSENIIFRLANLGMPNVQFQVDFQEKQLCASGADYIEFLFSANKKSKLQPIAEIASGGEIARVMLSLKALLAHSKTLPTIIFDEIDTGISGEIASKTATIMETMSVDMQIICITHLPQIAAKGQSHYFVYKTDSTTNIRQLSATERIQEIAQMLSGANISEAAIENAKILLGEK